MCLCNRIAVGFALLFCCLVSTALGGDAVSDDKARMMAVKRFAETVLAHGRDRYGPKHTPLFTEHLDVDTLRAPDRMYIFRLNKPSPRQWQPWQPVISSNIAFQGNLMRTLVGVSHLTGDSRFKDAYKESIRYYYQHYQNKSGMLHTGHHRFVDLKTDRYDGDDWPPGSRGHEMKGDMPWYPLFWEVDPEAARRMLDGHWNSHIKNWDSMDFTRHGYYHRTLSGDVWERPIGEPVQGIIRGDLTFFDSFSDIAWAGGQRALLSGDDRPRLWTQRLLARYIDNAHEQTGIPPCHHTFVRDFAGQNGYPQESWPEYAMLTPSPSESMIAYGATMFLRLADQFGKEQGSYIRESVRDYLKAYAKHAYFADDNTLQAILYDGRNLSDKIRPNVPQRELLFPPWKAHPGYLLSYALCYRLTGDDEIWDTLRALCRGNDLGDIGAHGDAQYDLKSDTVHSDPRSVCALIELFQASGDKVFLELARVVANNAMSERFDSKRGLFVSSKLHKTACLNVVEPLAFLRLEAALRGRLDEVPSYDGSTLGSLFDILRPTQWLPYHPTVSHRWYPTTELALCDELVPDHSGDRSVPHLSWQRGRHKRSAEVVFPDILSGPVDVRGPTDAPDSPFLLRGITIDSPHPYRFVGPGGLQMQEDFTLRVKRGRHTWDSGMAWYPSKNANYIFDIAADSEFTFGSVIYEYYYSGHRSGIVKRGSGTLLLTVDNIPYMKEKAQDSRAYQGDTIIDEGTLMVNNREGSGISPRSTVHVNDGGTLAGTGEIGTGSTTAIVHVHPGGTIATGASHGALTLRDGLLLRENATLAFHLSKQPATLTVTGQPIVVTRGSAGVRIRLLGDGLVIGSSHDLIDWSGAEGTNLKAIDFVLSDSSPYDGEFRIEDHRLRVTIIAKREIRSTTKPSNQRSTTKSEPSHRAEAVAWSNPAGGSWTEAANWSMGVVPNGRPQEWAQYTFNAPRRISEAAVYWFVDSGSHRVPESWSLRYRQAGKWVSIQPRESYGIEPDKLNRVHFESITTDAIRLVVHPQEQQTAGVLEWQIGPDPPKLRREQIASDNLPTVLSDD